MGDNLISEQYERLNAELHQRSDGYGSSAGKRWGSVVAGWLDDVGAKSAIDYGCGKGTLKPALKDHGYEGRVREYDPCVRGKDSVPRTASDAVVCLDVLEHVEEDRINDVLDHVDSLAKKAVFATVCSRPASEHKLLADGRNAHQTIRPLAWWVRRFEKRFGSVEWETVGDHEYKITALRKA